MNARLTRGIGCYVCKVCGHRTRETGDGASIGCCELCYEICGCECTMADEDECSAAYQEAAQAHAGLTLQLQQRNSMKGGK
jgi:hypothetical protein